ncbi:NADPH-adrenodoxin reductase [Coemansia sp. RSA 552]|nr:NADPH-adrenodoxin reductase [Coemansia sp. RSA 552]
MAAVVRRLSQWTTGQAKLAAVRWFSAVRSDTGHIAIVGGGAAGFYTAARLLAKTRAHIDIFERLPTPHGLVRYGVAPDHPEVKNCMSKFDEVAHDPRVRYFGNVQGQISLDTIRAVYDGVVLSYGASQDKRLGIPGEQGNGQRAGVVSAREFVAWYNGFPEAQGLEPDLTSFDRVVIIGHGNVALDCARILLTPVEELAGTDITSRAADLLRKSRVRHVEMVGRRGPLQISFTTKELREMTRIAGLQIICDTQLLAEQCQSAEGQAHLQQSRALKRIMDLLQKHSVSPQDADGQKKSFRLRFLESPVEVLFDQPQPEGIAPQVVRFQENRLEGEPGSAQAVSTGTTVDIPCTMALRSIGYASTELEGAPFDGGRRIVPNAFGRVTKGPGGAVIPGLYASGWVKRGPVGVIATTMQDAYRTGDAIAIDLDKGYIGRGATKEAIDKALLGIADRRVTNEGWKRLEAAEVARGQRQGKPREKVTDINEMLAIIHR